MNEENVVSESTKEDAPSACDHSEPFATDKTDSLASCPQVPRTQQDVFVGYPLQFPHPQFPLMFAPPGIVPPMGIAPIDPRSKNFHEESTTLIVSTASPEDMKQKLAARLRKRIEERDQANQAKHAFIQTSPSLSPLPTSTLGGSYFSSSLRCTDESLQKDQSENDERASKDVSTSSQPFGEQQTVPPSSEKEEAKVKKNEDGSKKKKKRKTEDTEKPAKKSSPKKATSSNLNLVFGPQTVKQALLALGKRASAVAIAEYIATTKPEFLQHFGSMKKLRYSVSGILSARTYSTLFQKKVVIHKGIRKADWLLVGAHAGAGSSEQLDADVIEEFAMQVPPEREANLDQELLAADQTISNGTTEPVSNLAGEKDPYEVKACQICNLGTDDDQLLLCDNCDQGYHMFCLDPPLEAIPTGSWFCDLCLALAGTQPGEDEVESEGIQDQSQEEEDLDVCVDGEDDDTEVSSNIRACEKHRRWKKRCPDNCPMRLKAFHKPGANVKPVEEEKRVKRRRQHDSNTSVPKRAKNSDTDDNSKTLIDIIQSALASSDRPATTSDIILFMEKYHMERLNANFRDWRDIVRGCLFSFFVPGEKDKVGRVTWQLPSKDAIGSIRMRQLHFKAPGRSSLRVFEPDHLETLKGTGSVESYTSGIEYINKHYPLETPRKLPHPGAVMCLQWSHNGKYLASCSTLGTIRLWDTTDWKITELRDKQESNLEEYYSLAFSVDDTRIAVGGKRKDKKKWNQDSEEATSLSPCIKIFDISSEQVILKLEGHADDILCIKAVRFQNELFFVSASQDGEIIKWHVDENCSTLLDKSVIADIGTKISMHIEFVPQTGNKFFVAACDDGLKVFDFETEQLVQSFPHLYGYLCDCVKFTSPKEIPATPNQFYLVTKGVELMDENDQVVQPNTCHLHRLTMPDRGKGQFTLEDITTFGHKDYHSNIWLLKLATNGRYVLSPTTEGKVFVWNLRSGELVAILNDHADREVRDIQFHPSQKLLASCADDSSIRLYHQAETSSASTTAMDQNSPKAATELPH